MFEFPHGFHWDRTLPGSPAAPVLPARTQVGRMPSGWDGRMLPTCALGHAAILAKYSTTGLHHPTRNAS